MSGGVLIGNPQACPTGTACQESTGICIGTGNYECDGKNITFECTGIGNFPDPFTCRSYYMCAPEAVDPIRVPCPNGYAYDPFTGQCSKKLEDPTKCPGTVPICTSAGQRGRVEGSTGFYYVCVPSADIPNTYVPQIYSCPFNYYYNGNNCVDPTPRVVDAQGKCLVKGNFYYPGDCQKHRDCASVGAVPIVRSCASAYRFDPIEQKCVHFDCSNYYLYN